MDGSWESHCECTHFIGKSSNEMGSFPLPYLIASYHQMNSHKQIHAGWKRKNSASMGRYPSARAVSHDFGPLLHLLQAILTAHTTM
jgi:hypothetical protein